MNFNLQALYNRRKYLPASLNVKIPLAERFPGEKLGFISIGDGGYCTAIVHPEKSGARVEKCESFNDRLSGASLEAALGHLKKKGGSRIIVGMSRGLEFNIKHNVGFTSQEAFAHALRTDPQKAYGEISAGQVYTGLLNEATGSGLIWGVKGSELTDVHQAAKSKGIEIVRECVPIFSLLNIMLADERVVIGGATPVVIDQGFVVAITHRQSAWDSSFGNSFLGSVNSVQALTDVSSNVQNQVPGTKLLVAASALNGGVSIDNALRGESSVEIEHYTIGNLNNQDLFVYATGLF